MHSTRRLALLFLTASLTLAAAGCQPEATGSAQFAVSVAQALSSSESISRVTVTSSGPGMPSVTTELVKTSGVWGGVVGNIPAGAHRAFLARAFDSSNTLLFEGSSSGVTISPQQMTLVAITLQELNPPPPFSNEAPIIQSVVATPTTVQTGGELSVQSTARDPNPGDSLSYAWTAPAGSFSNPTHPSTSWTAPGTTGLVTLTLTVRDSHGASSSMTLTVNVVNGSSEGSAVLDVRFNSWPVVSALSSSASGLEIGQSTAVTVTAADSDGDALTYQWAATCAGSWTSATSSTAAFSPSALPSGACNNCQLTVTVSDGRGGQTTGTVALCIAATTPHRFPPTLIRSYQSALSAQPSQQLTFEVVASDPQNSSLTFSWSASTGTPGTAQNSTHASRLVWTAPACVPGGAPASVTATLTNAYGLSTTRAFEVTGLPGCAAWSPTGAMASRRYNHTATLLPNGKVLVAGGHFGAGDLASAELYDPATGAWSPAGSMASPRNFHTATLLLSGKVLVAGGERDTTLGTAEVYDPVTNTWASTAPMASRREAHTATLLPNGKVLVVGGSIGRDYLASAELYDPATSTWASTGSMSAARWLPTATLLPNGKVLVAGGHHDGTFLASAEVYDPVTGTWAPTGSMDSARFEHTATLLPNGKVLVAGGHGNVYGAELYDSVTGTWASTDSMDSHHRGHTATLLPNGKVLVVGGAFTSVAEVYDPATGTWAFTVSMSHARWLPTATLLPSGKVLVAGGYGDSGQLSSAEVYAP